VYDWFIVRTPRCIVSNHPAAQGAECMVELTLAQIATLRSWFTPEEPGPLILANHRLNTGHGRGWADRWPDPQAVLIEVATNYALRGAVDALTPELLHPHLQGFVAAPAEFAALLQATFADLVVWPRVIYELDGPPHYRVPPDFVIRRLVASDAQALENLSADASWVTKTWPTPTELAESGYAWGAFAGEQLVSVACTFFLGNEYEDIGVVTEPAWRGLGLNSACAGGLCADIQARGHLPSWSTSTDNLASRRVAEKLGFTFVREDVLYVVGMSVPTVPNREDLFSS
jgi:GNAT superfamily N-acetyltransferase